MSKELKEKLRAVFLQYEAEKRQGLNELAGNGTPMDQAANQMETLITSEKIQMLERLLDLPNVYPEKINGQYTHVEAIYKSAIESELQKLKEGK